MASEVVAVGKRRRALAGTALLLVAAGALWLWTRPELATEAALSAGADASAAVSTSATSASEAAGKAPPAGPAGPPAPAGDAEVVAELQARFGAVIGRKHAQIRLLEQLIVYLKATYPEDWQQRLPALLEQLFPALAGELLEKFHSLLSYNEWLLADRDRLRALSPEQRGEALWARRYAAFGSDAEAIWAAELRNLRVARALAGAEADRSLNTAQKLERYVGAIRSAYGERAEAALQRRQTEWLNRFLALDSVQTELGQLGAGERRSQLRQIRAELGMDDAALARWEALDAQRDQRWQAGEQYMAAREQLLAQADGAALQQLQDQLFGADAEAIRREEAAGFYRFGRPRRIGRE